MFFCWLSCHCCDVVLQRLVCSSVGSAVIVVMLSYKGWCVLLLVVSSLLWCCPTKVGVFFCWLSCHCCNAVLQRLVCSSVGCPVIVVMLSYKGWCVLLLVVLSLL